MARTIRRNGTKDSTSYYPTKRARKIEKRKGRQATRRDLQRFM